jgi:hypothetical protein
MASNESKETTNEEEFVYKRSFKKNKSIRHYVLRMYISFH